MAFEESDMNGWDMNVMICAEMLIKNMCECCAERESTFVYIMSQGNIHSLSHVCHLCKDDPLNNPDGYKITTYKKV